MKKSVLCLGIISLFGINAFAYDIHHPDPMAILNGNIHPRARKAPSNIAEIQEIKKPASKIQPDRMYVRKKESKYIIKPEPYSIKSQKNDPELLGPQRTYAKDNNLTVDKPANNTNLSHSSAKEKMTKESCISLIGQEKYNSYIEKYDGETGAIKRCLILKRMRG